MAMKVTNLPVMFSWLEDNQLRLVEVQKLLFRLHNNLAVFLPLKKDNGERFSIPLNFSTDRHFPFFEINKEPDVAYAFNTIVFYPSCPQSQGK